jgi:hypothetical protein
MDDKTLEIQKKLLTQPDARKAFAADPRGFLSKEGISIPEGVTLPKSLPLADFEARITAVDRQLRARGIDPAQINTGALQNAGLMNLQNLQQMDQELASEQLDQVAGGAMSRTYQTAAGVALLVVLVGVGVWSSV